MLTALTDENFHDEVREANQPVVIHVQNMWKEISSPHMSKMSNQRTDIKFMTAFVQDVPDFKDNLAPESVPCYVLFTDGMVQEIFYEAMNFSDLRIWLTENV